MKQALVAAAAVGIWVIALVGGVSAASSGQKLSFEYATSGDLSVRVDARGLPSGNWTAWALFQDCEFSTTRLVDVAVEIGPRGRVRIDAEATAFASGAHAEVIVLLSGESGWLVLGSASAAPGEKVKVKTTTDGPPVIPC